MAILATSEQDLKIIEAMQENMFAHMLFFAERLPNCTVLKAHELTMINTHLEDDTFNIVCKAKLDEAHAMEAIESAINYFLREQIPFSWWVSPDDMPHDIAVFLEASGLQESELVIGMSLDIEDFAYEQAELRVERVLDPITMQDYAAILSNTLGETQAVADWLEQLMLFPFEQEDYEQLYVGYLDDEPVTCATLTLHSGVSGIYNLATIESHRRRGFATAMLQELLMRSQIAGHSIAVLQAQKNALNLYEKIGFERMCEFKVFKLNNEL